MRKLLLGLLLSLVFSTALAAQEHEAAQKTEHAGEAEEAPLSQIFRVANFVILFAGLAYVLRKPMKEFLETRRREISDGLNRASRAQAEAKVRMDEIEAKLARLSTDVAALRSEADKDARVEHEKLILEARREVDRIVEQGRQEIDRVARGVEREIKEAVADQVIDRAGRTLRSEMTQDDHKRVVVRFIKNL